MPPHLAREYLRVEDLVQHPENYQWTIDGEKVPVTEEDILIFQGYGVAELLNPENFWDPELFGFTSIFEFWGRLTAQIVQMQRERIAYRSYKWLTKQHDEKDRIFQSQVTGDNNVDLEIDQDDVTEYETKDPFGNTIHYRPMLREHKRQS
tara:strand:- start:846 stop:1295 length:450 start_codon:yes stop_codon:yes gene_type:complete